MINEEPDDDIFKNSSEIENNIFNLKLIGICTDNTSNTNTPSNYNQNTVLSVVFDNGKGYFTQNYKILGKIERNISGEIERIINENQQICNSNEDFEMLSEDDFIIDVGDEIIIAERLQQDSDFEKFINDLINKLRTSSILNKERPDVEELIIPQKLTNSKAKFSCS